MSGWVEFLDTTLRDGNKLPFVVLSVGERLAVARQLAELGVDIIEAGYPAASAEERETLGLIAREVREPMIAALAKATPQDVEAVLGALSAAARPHLHIFLPMSEAFLRGVLGKPGTECLKLIEQSVKAARGVRVQVSLAEVGEAEEALLLEAAQAAAEAGAQVLSLADTNGCLHPARVRELVGRIRAALKPEVLVGVHQHNDLGLATANTLAALEAGARHVEVTLGGIGGRAGNTPLEEVAFVLEAFSPRLGLAHKLRLDRLAGAATLLARLTGVPPHPNKPVLGRTALEAGRAADARQALDARLRGLLEPKTIGRVEDALFSDQAVSQAGFVQHLEMLGVDTQGVDLEKVYRLFLAQVRRKRIVHLSEVQAMIADARQETSSPYKLESFGVMTGSHTLPVGSVELSRGAERLVHSSPGTGPVDALCRAVDKAVGLKPRLLVYSADTVTEGLDARAEVTISLSFLGKVFHGRFGSTDVIEASLRAYLDAVNRIESHRQENPEEAPREFFIDGDQLWWE
jgi:2-isopropylmalate synthase